MFDGLYITWIFFIYLLIITKEIRDYISLLLTGLVLILLEVVKQIFNLDNNLILLTESFLIIIGVIAQNKSFYSQKIKIFLILSLLIVVSIFLFLKTFKYQIFIGEKNFLRILLLFLIVRDYKNLKDFFTWTSIVGLIFLNTFLNLSQFILNTSLLLLFYYSYQIVNGFFVKLKTDKDRYRRLVDRAIDFEIQEKINKVDDELKITYKKLKEIFKLSNKTIKPIDLEEISENIINGLINLGYKGVAVLIRDKNKHIFKKNGFIPEIDKYKKIDTERFNTTKFLLNDKVVILPIKKDNKTIGAIFVYKKSKILPDEIEYLQTYTNSVSTAIAKILYFQEKEELERNLFQAEKHAVLGKLSAGISHNLKNPLAVITSSTFSLRRRIEKGEKEKALKLIEKIEKNSKRAEEIINKLLEYAKPSFYSKQRVNLKDVVESSIDFVKSSIKGKDIKIKMDLKDVFINGDKNFLEQALINILLNSVDAIDNEGVIEVSLKDEKDKLVLEIKDNGKGIPKDIINSIFEPYFTTKIDGTGLGLAIVKKIIDEHGGKIDVISEEDKGTEFKIVWEKKNGTD